MNNSGSKIIMKRFFLFSVIFVCCLFSACKSVFTGVNGSPEAVMNTYGKYCAVIYNSDPFKKINLIDLKLVDGFPPSADYLRFIISRSRDNLFALNDVPKRSGEIVYAMVKKEFVSESKDGKAVLCGVIFYDKKSKVIYCEHVMILHKMPSGKYIISRVDISLGVKDKKKYKNGENLVDGGTYTGYGFLDRFRRLDKKYMLE